MSMTYHNEGRGHEPHHERLREFEAAQAAADKRLNAATELYRRTFGPGSIHSAQINDLRLTLKSQHGAEGVNYLASQFEKAAETGQRIDMNLWD
jgi:hypothetical protein